MFFTAIHQMMTEGVDLTLVIRKANGQLTVSTLPKSNGLKDEAQNHIIPLTVSGMPEELDAGFLQAVARPVQKAAGLITNMAQFEAQAEKAASESKAAKEARSKETKEEKEKREKYEKYLKKAEELIAAKKHSEAVTALGQARPYAQPQDQKKIDGMVEEQKKAMNKGSLFELMDEPAPQAQPQPQPRPMAATVQQRQQPQSQPMAIPVQQPPYPQQPQAPRPMAGQPQQPSMRPPQRPVQHQVPPQPQYAPQPSVQPPSYGGQEVTHWQEPAFTPEDYPMQYPADEEINYNPKDYEGYPDFPQSMLEPKYSPYQTV
ncbi:PRTRC system protein E [Bacteroides uniformis]|uniref:PRTRC system protein E n=1 Tax=Bacteroides uniformis TaxID=820 RepID=A0A4Q5E0U2_BACUN|nr:PRTRC system protein E [Bacteroides uniformis]KAB4217184.1 PRTRC system protein E [Bacteroides uniformis]KAB4221998.1 PRTRC system protein E [Bacteroides uniformis]KAB4225057.1 PRTRC system protein E [Bacteroides uniformis]KAB4235565.1 PRTRC system protein E [Bacteroides uniformis]KAB4238562.1 PRTRC system protein E [Bacteroides uniformis]